MLYRMNIGEMRSRVDIEKPNKSPDEYGELVPNWKAFVRCVPARIRAKSGGEQNYADQVVAVVSYEVVIRYRSDIDETMRLNWDGKLLNVDVAYDPDGMRKWLVIQSRCKS